MALSVSTMAFRHCYKCDKNPLTALLVLVIAVGVGTFGHRKMVDIGRTKSRDLGFHPQKLKFLLDQKEGVGKLSQRTCIHSLPLLLWIGGPLTYGFRFLLFRCSCLNRSTNTSV